MGCGQSESSLCAFAPFEYMVCGTGLPEKVRQEDGSREKYQRFFGEMDKDGSKTIE